MKEDVIASGEDVSGVVFTRDYFTSSYSNGVLEREDNLCHNLTKE